MELNQLVINYTSIKSQKEILFEELSSINSNINAKTKSPSHAQTTLRRVTSLESQFRQLQIAIASQNANCLTKEKKDYLISTKDFVTFVELIDNIIENCLSSSVNLPSSGKENDHTVKLPPIHLPTFDGTISEFSKYKALFDSLVHNNKSLNDTQKLQYLVSTTTKEANSLVSAFEMIPDNYLTAYNILVSRYANKRRTVAYYVQQILTYKSQQNKGITKFLDVHRNAYNGLLALNLSNLSEVILFELMYSNCDTKLQESFDHKIQIDELPTFTNLLTHIECHARTYELKLDQRDFISPEKANHNAIAVNNKRPATSRAYVAQQPANSPTICFYCKDYQKNHSIYTCQLFKSLTPQDKYKAVKSSGHCTNCLAKHPSHDCKSKNTCRLCMKKHHTYLHFPEEKEAQEETKNRLMEPSAPESTANHGPSKCLSCINTHNSVIFSTINCHILASDNSLHAVRILLDSASDTNLITYKLASKLKLPIQPDSLIIQGISKTINNSLGKVNVILRSPISDDTYGCSASILHSICDNLPTKRVNSEIATKFKKLPLADPYFYLSSPIELLLGVKAYTDLLSAEQPNLIKGSPTAIRTIFGWILLGEVDSPPLLHLQPSAVTLLTLEATLTRFWEVESIHPEKENSAEDDYCENYFITTTQRSADGRYIVRIPFKPGKNENLGKLENRDSAMRCFNALEKRLSYKTELLSEFHAFMKDYIDCNHMSLATASASCMLPYSLVSKESTTTRTRVVFNPSFRCNKSGSMNDQIYSGPNLQKDLSTILTIFRLHSVVLTCDIKAMFRQILLHPDDLIYQHIFYKEPNEKKVKEYELKTVTYGFVSSPWLAQRVLKQLAIDEQRRFPEASTILLENTYMDDLNFGSSSIPKAKKLRDDLIALLSSACLPLRKWSSNCQEAINDLPDGDLEKPLRFLCDGPVHKVLGLQWDPQKDYFVYSFKPYSSVLTKRSIIGYISGIFDPNGYIAPIVFTAKHFLQKLWLLKIDWDDHLPTAEADEWLRFSRGLNSVTDLCIPRCLKLEDAELRLVGFCDASIKGYSSVIYLHVFSNTCHSVLIKSKSRVAPLKLQTIPKLEIMAADLLAQTLVSITFLHKKFKIISTHLYSDSQIALAWIKKSPLELTTFVAHRVQSIQNLTLDCSWSYIPTSLNPADLSCRGIPPEKIINNQFWFSGPPFLQTEFDQWPTFGMVDPPDLPEVKKKVFIIEKLSENWLLTCFDKFSSFIKLQRTIAWMKRFIFNCCHPKEKNVRPLATWELEQALLLCVKVTQEAEFREDILKIQKNQLPSLRIRSLSPFIDQKDILRVGGRIRHADLPANSKHPMLLPKHSRLTKLLCEYFHRILLHSGPKTTRSFIQKKYWILSLQTVIKQIIRQCKICYKLSAKPDTPAMSDLPTSRLQYTRAFYQVGLDFGGPFTTKDTGLRKSRHCKTYLLVIVCHATKAVYLDAVSDLSTDAFLAAFSRFTSRRGLPYKVFSDNGTNFVGASNEIKKCTNFLQTNYDSIFTSMASLNIKWIFNVPHAPHMAGLQEAAVKSAKRLLLRQLGAHILTFEEFSTVIAKVEAVLNSRPIGYSTSDPTDDLDYLSPGHFLIGAPMLSSPEKMIDPSASIRHRWKLVNQLNQYFWTRWKNEYVNTLVQRQKWHKVTDNLQIGELVYIADIPSSPLSWPIGRVIAVFPGSDGVVRSATVRTTAGLYKRPVVKLVKLPNLD